MAVLKRDAEGIDDPPVAAAGEDSSPSAESGVGAAPVAGSHSRNEPGPEAEIFVAKGLGSPAVVVEVGTGEATGPEAPAAVEPVETVPRNKPSPETETLTCEIVDTPIEGEATEDAGAREGRGSKERLARRSGEGRSPMDILAERFGDKLKGPGTGGKDLDENRREGQSGAVHQASRNRALVGVAPTNPAGIECSSVAFDVPAFEARPG